MVEFSANLGFLWADLPIPQAIKEAKAAGFAAVECHWPYETEPELVKAALAETGLTMIGLNTACGDVDKSEMGLSALPERGEDAQAAIDEAIFYAKAIGALNIHVMAGISNGQRALEVFKRNLLYACKTAEQSSLTILIEPINAYDVPGYFLNSFELAEEIIHDLAQPNLKLMFDCYHAQLISGDLTNNLKRLMHLIGHIQFASAPLRSTPNVGELNFSYIFKLIEELGYLDPLGAEYKPDGPTDQTLDWMKLYKSAP